MTTTSTGQDSRESGLRNPGPPPEGSSAFEVAMHYLRFFESDFARARRVVKGRARNVTIWAAVLTASIAVVGALTAVSGLAWLGLVSTAAAGAVTVIERWDAMFRHREMWVQRSAVTAELQKLRRWAEFWRATEGGTEQVGKRILDRLEEIMGEDLSSWTGLRELPQQRSGEAQDGNGTVEEPPGQD